MKPPSILALAGLLAGCDHRAPAPHYPNQNGGSPGVYDAGESGACSATCSTAPGTILPYDPYDRSAAADAELWAGLVGVWQICDGGDSAFQGAPALAPADTIGIEFGPPITSDTDPNASAEGNLFFLTHGPSGPVRGAGFEYQQTYLIAGGWIYCFQADSMYTFGFKYSPCPREWELAPWGDDGRRATLVPF